MPICYDHKDVLEEYVRDNIEIINAGINAMKKTHATEAEFDDIDIKNYLNNKWFTEEETVKSEIYQRFILEGCTQVSLITLANEYVFYHTNLKKYFESRMFRALREEFTDRLNERILSVYLENSSLPESATRYIKTPLKKILMKSTLMALQNGFSLNISNIDSGVMMANAGDSAQFMFVARAILAGYNCSNVDVRSSRYDAVIDYKGRLFKVQVKGISDRTVSFKDRDRGGRGIDTQNARNQGQRITVTDCDIFVAVDKQIGMCYIIPMIEIDTWDDAEIVSVNVSRLEGYRENWLVIDSLYDRT